MSGEPRGPGRPRVLALVLAVAAASCGEAPLEEATVEVRRGPFERVLSVRGRLVAAETERLGPAFWGKLAHVVPEGTRVEEGDVLFGLETESMEERLEQKAMELSVAQARFDTSGEEARLQVIKDALALKESGAGLELAELRHAEAEEELARTRRQVEAHIRPRREILDAERKLRDTELALEKSRIAAQRLAEEIASRRETAVMERQTVLAGLEKARTEYQQTADYLAKANVRAPRAGIVIHARKSDGQPHQVGEQVGSRNTIVEIPDISRLEIEAEVNEVDVGGLSRGLPARLRFGALPGLVIEGRVRDVGAVGKELHDSEGRPTGVRAFDLVVELGRQDERLRPGMSARVELILEQVEEALLMPIDALRGDREEAWALDDSGQRRELRIGSSNELDVVVLDGLEPGDRLRLRGSDAERTEAGS